MDDTCAVCAETLEWAAYGQCGHREVCSTCIARLRFICDDRRCCICKSESNVVFVTKALGDYTKMINDFSFLPVDPKEGRVGPYWYHEGTQAFFDDLDHYKMIAAMCKLSCIVCNKKDEQGSEASKRRGKLKNIEQLKGHLFHHHRLLTCSLCLEGRKIFISEQKLYTREQLNRHINNGDSEVDGSESERGGFKGHPMCEFCRNPFYGDNELYTHMSTEHYTCHICQRQRSGQYDYYRNYDDLEIHFRGEHFLCEDEACLDKKFIVFATESEMKRHNAMEHGGRMSRSKRNAVLQIPISFQYRRSREQDQSRRRGGLHPDYSDGQLSLAIQASLETTNADIPRATSSRAQADSDHRETSEIDSFLGSFGPLASVDPEPSPRYQQAVGQNSRNVPLEESSFPPLPVAARKSHQKTRKSSGGLSCSTMAGQLRRQNKVNVLNVSQVQPVASRQPSPLVGGFSQLRPVSNSGHASSSGLASACSSKPGTVNGIVPPNISASLSTKARSIDKVTHSASTPNLVERGSLDPAISKCPTVSAAHSNKLTGITGTLPKVEDVNTANKSLVERIRADLEFDKDKYAAFKEISSEFRQGLIETGEYLAYVHQFGLSHLILELARLCPDPQKQIELVEAYSGSLGSNGPPKDISVNNGSQLKQKKSSKKGKEKCEDNGTSGSNGALKLTSVSDLKLNHQPSQEVEILSKDGYRSGKLKSKVLVADGHANVFSGNQPSYETRVQNDTQSAVDGSKKSLWTKGGGNKPLKKTSKFHRVRLGESSSAAVLDRKNSDAVPDPDPSEGQSDKNEGLPVRGAWKNGGGRKLVAKLR